MSAMGKQTDYMVDQLDRALQSLILLASGSDSLAAKAQNAFDCWQTRGSQSNIQWANDLNRITKVYEQQQGRDPQTCGQLYRGLYALTYADHIHQAIRYSQRAIELAPDQAAGWNQAGHGQRQLGNLTPAIGHFKQAEDRATKNMDKAFAFGNLGAIYLSQKQLDHAEPYLLKALALNRTLKRQAAVAGQYGNLASLYHAREDLDKALTHFLKAVAINEQLGRNKALASQYANVGSIYQTQQQPDKAREYYRQALGLLRQGYLNGADYVTQVQRALEVLDSPK